MSFRGTTIAWSIAVIISALLLAVVCRMFVVELYTVAPQQMEQTLLAGDRVVVEKWHYGVRLPQSYVSLPLIDTLPGSDIPARLPKQPLPYRRWGERMVGRNDVILCNYPIDKPIPLSQYPTIATRCVGVPGDTVTAHQGRLYINGEAVAQSPIVTEAYLVPDSLLPSVEAAMRAIYDEMPPRQSIGEHRTLFYIDRYSYDRLCRELPDSILPRAINLAQDNYTVELPPCGSDVTITPHNAAFYAYIINRYEPAKVVLHNDALYRGGRRVKSYRFTQPYYWVLSDNRTSATDSRTFGVLPHSHVIGRCGMIVFSIDATKRGFNSWRINRFFQMRKL